MYFYAVPDVPDPGNCKKWLGKDRVQLLSHTPHVADYRDIFIFAGFFMPSLLIHLDVGKHTPLVCGKQVQQGKLLDVQLDFLLTMGYLPPVWVNFKIWQG